MRTAFLLRVGLAQLPFRAVTRTTSRGAESLSYVETLEGKEALELDGILWTVVAGLLSATSVLRSTTLQQWPFPIPFSPSVGPRPLPCVVSFRDGFLDVLALSFYWSHRYLT